MADISMSVRVAIESDLSELVNIEQQCFYLDRLSARSLKRWIIAKHGIMLVVEHNKELIGYGLVCCHKGTRLARLYSLAVKPSARGKGVAKHLLTELEKSAAMRGRIYMRLEVAVNNKAAIALYECEGYRVFGQYSDYYDDHSDALRMQKNIRGTRSQVLLAPTPWYQQTTEFTCGPAALLMAMARVNQAQQQSQQLELDLWREATTIFMTSGHGGCHPLGLALAANKRGYTVSVMLNTQNALFVDGVRNESKKAILHTVHNQFSQQIAQQNIDVSYQDVQLTDIECWLSQGMAVLLLISTYRFDGKKSPHWVCVTHLDEHCLYVHDPYCETQKQFAIDCQHVPVSRADFSKMAAFGVSRLKTALAISYNDNL